MLIQIFNFIACFIGWLVIIGTVIAIIVSRLLCYYEDKGVKNKCRTPKRGITYKR